MSRCKEPLNFSGVNNALGELVEAQLAFGLEALNLVTGSFGLARDLWDKLAVPAGTGCCDIPDPCWMPKKLGEICCELAAGDTGEVCIVVINEDFVARNFTVQAAGDHSTLVQISQSSFTLGPKERKVVSARFKMPAPKQGADDRTESCCLTNDFELLLWIHGCQNHYLNWFINRTEKSGECCHEVCVADKPDYELHWYDHFHINRPCPPAIRHDPDNPPPAG